jgi:hypothetical protein
MRQYAQGCAQPAAGRMMMTEARQRSDDEMSTRPFRPAVD